MEKLKLKIKKVVTVNPTTKQKSYAARVITNGTAVYTDIVGEATRRTTLHVAEAKLAAELLVEEIAKRLQQGYIVDMGPVGRLYPTCYSKWTDKPEDMKLAEIQPFVNYHPSEEIAAAIKGATLAWHKETEEEETEGTDTPAPTDTPSEGGTSDAGSGGDGGLG